MGSSLLRHSGIQARRAAASPPWLTWTAAVLLAGQKRPVPPHATGADDRTGQKNPGGQASQRSWACRTGSAARGSLALGASSTSTEPFAPVAACPGGQARQSVSLPSPSRLAYRPAGQGRQAVKLAFENRPASQTEHAVVGSPSSSVTANFPESQDLQSDALSSRISSLYLPAGHTEQLSDPFDAKVPMLQMSQNVAPWLAEKKPASQEGQEASPGMNWKLPGGQGIGNPVPMGHISPGLHCAHWARNPNTAPEYIRNTSLPSGLIRTF
eukprot:scaffold2076_cov221-Pinguiococcus_pyrenoidosus.AAC.1